MGVLNTQAVRVHEHGGPEVLRAEPVEVADPSEGEVRITHEAIGLNYLDTYHRSGLYPLDLPATIGSEGAGLVEAVGPGVGGFEVGDRVAYPSSLGAYSGARTIDAARLVKVPGDVDFETAAAAMLKGLTAWYLLHRTHRLEAGETILVHAAAGGVGSILCRWAAAKGARVIGTAGSRQKAERALAGGCDAVILYDTEDVAERVAELTDGEGVRVAYDGVGKATFDASLRSLARFGLLVSFGNASGPVPPVSPLALRDRSAFLTRPSLGPHIADPDDLSTGAAALFEAMAAGAVQVAIEQRFRLEEAGAAHEALESRSTVGSTVLLP